MFIGGENFTPKNEFAGRLLCGACRLYALVFFGLTLFVLGVHSDVKPAAFVGVALFAALEEFLFRGLLLAATLRYCTVNIAVLVNCLLFALIHFNLQSAPILMLSGAAFAYVTIWSRHWIWAALLHFGVNFFVSLRDNDVKYLIANEFTLNQGLGLNRLILTILTILSVRLFWGSRLAVSSRDA